jgi:ornithine racemase
MYPRLSIDLKKVQQNLDTVCSVTKKSGCSLMIVTKSFCADRKIVELIAKHPDVEYLADSRVQNIRTYRDLAKQTVLLRLPQACEIEEVVRYVDISLNSEIETIRLIDEEAKWQGKVHKIILMIDLGDLREGIFFEDEDTIIDVIEEITKLTHVTLYGLGVNLTCYGAVIPKKENLSILVDLAKRMEQKFDIQLPMISGGNSSSYYLIDKGELPNGINNLRLGEAFILGNETAYGGRIQGTVPDAVILEAQIIEIKTKRSLPIGEIGMDAFGQRPQYEDRGDIKRAILAIGKQDADVSSMIPIDTKIEILGASSDHLIMDVTNSDTTYKVGDIIQFTLGYGGLLKAATSAYVAREYKE